MATMQHKNFCVRELIKTESATAVQRVFRLRFNIQPPTRKSIRWWNHQIEQISCLCKGKVHHFESRCMFIRLQIIRWIKVIKYWNVKFNKTYVYQYRLPYRSRY